MAGKQFDARTIEAIARSLGDTGEGLSNSEIDNVSRACRFPREEPGTKWQRIFNTFVRDQNKRGDRTGILGFIRNAMRPALYTKTPERFETLRENLNQALAFEGLAVMEDGKLVLADRASTTISDAKRRASELRGSLVSRGVHPDVLAFCKEELLTDDYFHAVLEATKSLAQKLRDRTGLTDDGGALVDRSLSGATPMLAINALKTDSERSEQKGFANLCKGIFGMFRNPTAHAPRIHWSMSQEDAEDLMSLLSLAHRRLDAAHMPPRT